MSHYKLRKRIEQLRAMIECGIAVVRRDVPLVTDEEIEEFFRCADPLGAPIVPQGQRVESEVGNGEL